MFAIENIFESEGYVEWFYIGEIDGMIEFAGYYSEDILANLLIDLYETEPDAREGLIKFAEYILKDTGN